MKYIIDDKRYHFRSAFNTETGAYARTGILDENGKDKYQNGILMRKRYLMAKVTIPTKDTLLDKDFEEQMKSSAFASKINADISAYAGKTIAVLCDSFYSNDMD